MDKPDFMSKAAFVTRTTSLIRKVVGRNHIGIIDTALSAYHKTANASYRLRADLAAVVVQECTAWLDLRVDQVSEGTTLRRPVVTQLRDQAFQRVKWDTYNHHKSLRGGVYHAIPLDNDYQYERQAYLSTGKTQTPLVANELKSHMAAMPAEITQIIGHNVATPSALTPTEVMDISNSQTMQDYGYARVQYKRKRDRLAMLINFDANGLAYSDMNTKFDTGGNPWPFAMDAGGGLFAGAPGNLNHSSFLSGKNVICAGSIESNNGRISYIDNLSGHYKPKRSELWYCVCALHNAAVDLHQVEVVIAHEGNSLKKILDGQAFWHSQNMPHDQTSNDNGFNWV